VQILELEQRAQLAIQEGGAGLAIQKLLNKLYPVLHCVQLVAEFVHVTQAIWH
jgi:hypothetical protein